MKEYNVRVTSVNHHDWVVVASSKEDAIQKIQNQTGDYYFCHTDHVSESYEAIKS